MTAWLASCLFVVMGLIGAQSAVADGSGNVDTVTGAGCMEDVAGFGLNCTANDIQIASVANLTILDDGCAFPGDTVQFTADFEVLLTAQERHDLGLWFADDGDPNGDGALTGSCTVSTPAYAPDPPWLDLDGTGDTFLDTNIVSNIQDTCGDIDADHNPLFPTVTLTVTCVDTDGDGQLNLPNCTSWKQPGDNDLCTSPIPVADVGGPGLDSSGVPPGSPAKCRCDIGFQVPINVPGQIKVDKVTDPSGDSTSFNFALTGGPDSVNVPFSLTDASAPFESSFLDAGTYQVTETVPADWELTSASCTSDSGTPNDTSDDVTFAYMNGADIALSAGEIITCTFNDTLVFVPAPAIDLVKDGALDVGGDGVANPGDLINYTFQVTNVGNVDLSSVAVTDPMVSPITCPQTTLSADPDGEAPFVGESMTCTGSYAISQADIDAGQKDNTATAQGTDPNGTTVTDQDSHSEPITQTPALTLDKTADVATYDAVGDVITYTYVATNTGNQTLTNVTISDPLSGLSALTCTPAQPATLAPTEAISCSATYSITQADIDNGQVVNTATADSDQTDPVQDSVTVTAAQNPLLSVLKALTGNADEDGSTTVSLGDTLTYTITATNDGNQTLTNVTVSDSLTGDSTSCASVAPGATCVLVVTYVVTQADVDAGVINNVGTADSDQTPPTTDPEEVPVPQNPSILADKALTGNADEDGSTTVSLGDTLSYTITATNDGNVTLTNVTVDDDLTGTTDAFCAASLAPGESCSVVVTYVVTQADVDAGVIDNLGTVEGTDPNNQPVTDTDPETVPVPQNPLLSVLKALTGNADEDGSTTVSLGDTLTYTLTATNDGNQTLTNVVVSDSLTGDSTSCASVAPGATCVLVVTYVVTQADVDAGVINNVGTADSDQTPPTTDPEEVPVPQNPSILADKALTGNADEDGSTTVSLGDTLSYTITATNDGNVTLTNVTVDDDLTGTTDAFCAASLAPGESCSVVVTYVVTQADVDAGVIDNLGTVEGTDPNNQPVTDTDPETVPVPQNPLLSVLKALTGNADEDGSTTVSLGDTLTYTLTATNDGNQTLTNVVVSDSLTGDSTSCASVAPGATCVLVVTYVVTQADVDAGVINNVGTADSDQTPPTTDPEEVPVPQNPSILADKALTGNADEDGSTTVSLGDTLSYTITATNDGNVTLTNVTVDDDLTGTTDAFCAASLAPGESCSVVVTYVVTQADVDAGVIDNLGTVEGTDPNNQPVTDTDPETVPVPQNPLLSVLKALTGNADEDGSTTVSLGDTLTYTLTATNDGNQTLTNVVVSDSLTGDSTSCASVAPGATCVLVVTYVVTQADVDAGVINNVGTADSDQTPPTTDPEEVPVPQNPSILADKALTGNADEDGSTTVSLGDTLSYTITATNDGNVTLTNVTVDDDLTGTTDAFCAASLAPGESCSVVVTYVVTQADVDAGVIDNLGTVEGTDPNGQPVTDTDPETVPVPQNPLLSVLKVLTGNADEDGSTTVSLGDTLTYTLTATNDGNQTLTNVVVSDSLTGDSTSCASVAPGATCVLVVTYVVTQADVDAGVINNVGTADSDQTPPTTDPEEVPVPQNPAIDLVKDGVLDVGADGVATPGDLINYTFAVTNTGNVTLSNVLVSDPLVSPISCPSGNPILTMAPGASETCTGSYAITQADIDAGVVNNTATAAGTGPQGQPASDEDSHSEPIPQNPALAVVKDLTGNADEDGSGDVSLGDTLEYTITATNTGNQTLTNVLVSDSLTGDSTSCASVAPGATCVLVVTYVVTQADVDAGVINNVGTADSDQTGPEEDPETVPVPQTVTIDLVKDGVLDVGADGVATPGDLINYTFAVTNTGNVTLSNVLVSDPLVSPISCPSGNPIPTMAPGASETCTGSYAITQADIDAGVVNNTATAAGTGPQGQPASDEDSDSEPIPQNPAVLLDKTGTLDLGADGIANPGDLINYTFVVTNTGNVTLSNVLVSDPLVSPISCPSGNPIPTMAPGASETCTGSYAITQADIDAGVVNNTATAAGTGPQGQPASDEDSHSEPIPQNPAIQIVKTFVDYTDADGSGTVSIGDTLMYTFDVTNIGNVTLSNVDVTDPLIPMIDCPAPGNGFITLAPDPQVGSTVTCTGDYVVMAADDTLARVDNTATTTGDCPDGTVDCATDEDSETVPVVQQNQRSIQLRDLTIVYTGTAGDGVEDNVSGTLRITDESENGNKDELDVAVISLDMFFEAKLKGNNTQLLGTVSCDFTAVNDDAEVKEWTYVPGDDPLLADPLIFGKFVDIDYSCTIEDVPSDARSLNVTAQATVGGRVDQQGTPTVFSLTESLTF